MTCSRSGGVFVEPVSDGIEVEYNFSISFGPTDLLPAKNATLAQNFEAWLSLCRPFAFRQSERNSASPLFMEMLGKGNRWFEFLEAGNGRFNLKLKKSLWISYVVNDEPIFQVQVAAGTAFTQNFEAVKKGVSVKNSEASWKADSLLLRRRVRYGNREVKKGGFKGDLLYSRFPVVVSKEAKILAEGGIVRTTRSGLKYQVLEDSKWTTPDLNDWVMIEYVKWPSGVEFSSAAEARFKTVVTKVSETQGVYREILLKMKVGMKLRVWIPSNLAKNQKNSGGSRLVYDIKLISASRKKPSY